MSEREPIATGKTKTIYDDWANPDHVIVISNDQITAGDGQRSDTLPGKGRLSTATTANVFDLLTHSGVPNHYIDVVAPRRFKAQRLEMLPIEVVARMRAAGSYVERNPTYSLGDELGELAVELFLKDDTLRDPLIKLDHVQRTIELRSAHVPFDHPESVVETRILTSATFNHLSTAFHTASLLVARAFGILAPAWQRNGFSLADMKAEVGRSDRIRIGDVIDNDSWRLWKDGDPSKPVDKDLYRRMRPGDSLHPIVEAYEEVAEVSQALRPS